MNKKPLFVLATLLIVLLLISGNASVVAYDEELVSLSNITSGFVYANEEMLYTPWRVEGTSTTSLTAIVLDEDDLETVSNTITFTSSLPVTGSLTASHEGMIELFLIGSGITDVTVSGLAPNKEYHLYRNHYGDHTPFIADDEGAYTYATDLSENTYMYIQDSPSTFFLVNDVTGGDCEQIGVWDVHTVTCTLSGDVTQSIQIGNSADEVSDGITLDGNGYTQTGSNMGNGVYVYNANFVTLKNITINNFTAGVKVFESNDVTLQNIHTNVYNEAVLSSYSKNFVVNNSVLNASNFGFSCFGSTDVLLEQVEINTIRATGLSVRDTNDFSIQNVQVRSENGGGLNLHNSFNGNISDVSSTVRRTSAPFHVSGTNDTHFNHIILNYIANGLPLYYHTNKNNEILDGDGEDVFNIYCVGCSNSTIKNYRFTEYSNGGIRLWGSNRVVIAQNEFDKPTMPLQILKSSGTVVHDNSFRSNAILTVPYVLYTKGADVVPTVMYHNTFFSNSGPVQSYSQAQDIMHSQEMPLGGNHWARYDEPDEGCEDLDGNLVCDTPYHVPNSAKMEFIDEYPWTSANAWKSVLGDSSLVLPTETEYVADGIHPNKGIANEDELTFKVVHTGDTKPNSVDLTVVQDVVFDTDYFLQPPYVSENDSKSLHRAGIRYDLPETVLGYEGILGYRPGFDKGESMEFTPEGRAKYEASVHFYVTHVSGGIGSEYLTVAFEALDAEGVVVGRSEKKVDVSDIPEHTSVFETLVTSSSDANISSVRFKVIDASFSIVPDAEAWIASFTFSEKVSMSLGSTEELGEVYSVSSTFPKGTYRYFFTASHSEGLTLRYPQTDYLSFTTGYSNIVFLHGHQGSRLYTSECGEPSDSCLKQHWPPSGNDLWYLDIPPLYLNTDGSSKNDVLVGDIIQERWTITDIRGWFGDNVYKSFFTSLQSVKDQGVIYDWQGISYDWRFKLDDIVNSNTHRKDGTSYSIMNVVQELANSSDSGKVTLIGHSNGGLLAKKIVNTLKDEGKARVVDQVILVASPQIGTPQAVPDMLHGRFLPDATIREFARNMPSAYHLLPSAYYMDHVTDVANGNALKYTALISFDHKSLGALNDGAFNFLKLAQYYKNAYGTTTIQSYAMFRDFLTGADEARTEPAFNDTKHPLQFRDRELLLQYTTDIHEELDENWTHDVDGDGVPDFRVIQIAGWGDAKTVQGITYFAHEVAVDTSCNSTPATIDAKPCVEKTKWVLDVKPNFTKTYDGDGTVVLPSAVAMGEVSNAEDKLETYYVDLYTHNKFMQLNINRSHGSILEVSNVQGLIENLIQYKNNPTIELEYIKDTQAELPKDALASYLRLSIHSPVNLHIYDSEGNHVGPSSTVGVVDENIPNAYYLEFGEGKYLGVPLDVNKYYTVELEGTGSGIFTLEMSEEKTGVVQKTQTFSNIVVSTTTKSSFTFLSVDDVSALTLDYNGDGFMDDVVLSDEYKSFVTFTSVENELQKLSSNMSDNLVKQVETAETLFKERLYLPAQILLETVQKRLFMYTQAEKNKQIKTEYQNVLRISAMLDVLIDTIKRQQEEK